MINATNKELTNNEENSTIEHIVDLYAGMYLACFKDNEWYIGIVQEIADDSDIYVKLIQ